MTALLVTVMTVLFSFQSLFCRLFSQKSEGSTAATSAVFSVAYGAFAGVVTFVLSGLRFAPSGTTLACGLLNAVMLLLYNTAMIGASRRGSYAFQMICSLFGGIVLPLLHEVLFLGGKLSPLQSAAIVMMLVAFVLLNLQGLSLRGSSGRFVLWCALLFGANGMYGIMMNLQQRLMNGAERNEMILLTYLGMAVLYAALQLVRDGKALKEGFRLRGEPLVYLLICCASATAAAHLMLYLLTRVDAAVLYTIDSGGVLVLSVLYAFVLFRERPSAAQVAGMLLSAASIVMLSL